MGKTRDIATVEIKITRRLDGRELLNLAYRDPADGLTHVMSAYIAPSPFEGGRARAVLNAAEKALAYVIDDLARWGLLDEPPSEPG